MISNQKYYAVGTKFYRYVAKNPDNEPKNILQMCRVTKIDEEDNLYSLNVNETIDGKPVNYTTFTDVDCVHDKYIRLNPDAYITFSIVDDGPVQDVLVAVHPTKTDVINPKPFAICRQDAVNIFRMASEATPVEGQVWAGISINQNNCPPEIDICSYLDCEEIIISKIVAAYIDDTLDDILAPIWPNRFDNVLETYINKHKGDNLTGMSSTLRGLLDDQNFMYDFHEAVGVTDVPFPICNDSKNLLISVISQMRHKAISDIYITPYDKSIRVDELERPYYIMCPDFHEVKKEDQKLFIVEYEEDDNASFLEQKYGTTNKDQIIKNLGFNIL